MNMKPLLIIANDESLSMTKKFYDESHDHYLREKVKARYDCMIKSLCKV